MRGACRIGLKGALLLAMLLGICFQRRIIDALAGAPSPDQRLITAASAGDTAAAAEALADGASIGVTDSLNRTALSYAAMRGEAELVRRLLDAGADVNL